MKHFLGVMGSPRKNGNTHILVSRILKGAQDAGAHTETILLDDYTINECNGCHVCWEGKECSKCDDMNNLYQKIIESDVIVFGTPVYWYGPTALMKAFLDRFVYFNCPENRQKIHGKSAVLVIPFEEDNPETAAPLEMMFKKSLHYLEIELIETILAPGVTRKGEVNEKQELLGKCYELGKELTL